jgi:hypothetical protein
MTSILMEPAAAIFHRRNVVFDNGTDPDFDEFPEESPHAQSNPRSRSRAIRNGGAGQLAAFMGPSSLMIYFADFHFLWK